MKQVTFNDNIKIKEIPNENKGRKILKKKRKEQNLKIRISPELLELYTKVIMSYV